MEDIQGIPIFDDDFYKMIFRFVINISFLSLIIRWLYYSATKRKDFLFTYFMIGIIVFFLCFTLKKFELDLGMALGLFAIFGIIRYRTDVIPIKEMTYLFVVIGVSVINSLANQKMSYAELIAANVIVVASLYIIEKMWFNENISSKTISCEISENIKPENLHLLKADLEDKLGLEIESVKVGSVSFAKNAVSVKITYYN
jgi:hypothetical protein